MNKPKLYIDLDDVLADFSGGFERSFGVSIEEFDRTCEGKTKDRLLLQLKGDQLFWENLEFTKNGEILWNYLKYFKPIILSSPVKDRACNLGKMEWVRKNLGDDVPIILEEDKSKYSKEGSILIDDYSKNIEEWRALDGEGILYNAENSMYSTVLRIYDLFDNYILYVDRKDEFFYTGYDV